MVENNETTNEANMLINEQTGADNMARNISTFYSALIKYKLPDDFARMLTLQYLSSILSTVMSKR